MLRLGALLFLAIFLVAATPIPQSTPLVESGRSNRLQSIDRPDNTTVPISITHPYAQTNDVSHASMNSRQSGWLDVPFEGWVAIGTFLLFFATSGLWIFTGFMWWSTRTAAIAAKAAADALPIVERAYLFADRTIRAKIDWPQNRSDTRFGEFFLVVRNHGKTPAILRSIRFGVIPLAANEPNIADVAKATTELPTEMAALESGGKTDPLVGRFRVAGENVLTLSGDTALFSFFLIGKINYDDIFGKQHETVFCRICGVLGRDQDFNTFGPDQLNFHN